MAIFLARTPVLFHASISKQTLPHLLKNSLGQALGGSTSSTPVAHLTSHGGQKAPRRKPWPYKERGFRYWHMPLDRRPDLRLDENSKIIVIDGNVATGKTTLGQKIAKEFDMFYVPDFTNDDMCDLLIQQGADIREFDEQLPIKARTCDFERFYSQKGSKKVLENISRTQYELFRRKLFRYAQTITAHVLSTGQGVVMNRGMWSDLVFAHTLRRHGYMRAQALKVYEYQYEQATDYFWHPHLIIYLDAPISLVRDRIKKRNVPWEANSPVLTDEYLHTISEVYKHEYLPRMKPWSEILTYDLAEAEEPNFEEVIEDLESLDLDNAPLEYEKRFSKWNSAHNIDINNMRSLCSPAKSNKLMAIFDFHPPYEAPEVFLDSMDREHFYKIVLMNPKIRFDPRFQPDDPMARLRLI